MRGRQTCAQGFCPLTEEGGSQPAAKELLQTQRQRPGGAESSREARLHSLLRG